MRREDYPPQEPLSEFARGYGEEVWRRVAPVHFEDHAFGADPYQRVALVVPARPTGAVFAFVHGGGWTSGYKEWNLFMAPAFAEAGVIFASIGYRLAPGTLFPHNLEDCADGIAWLHRHVGARGGNPDRLFIGGHSAGGHLTALLAVTGDWQARRGLPRNVVRGCLPVSGVYQFGEGSGLSMRPRFLGPADPAIDRAASPLLRLEGESPPFFAAWGGKDFPHLIVQARAMIAALRSRGGAVEELELPGASHLEAHLATGGPPWTAHALDFIGRHAAS